MEDKKDNIKDQVNVFLDSVLTIAENQGKIDYFTMEISNHNGNLKMDYKFKDVKKVY